MGIDDYCMDAVVHLFCKSMKPNYKHPWQNLDQQSSKGSAFVIDGQRVLTNAHCVQHHTQVKLKRRGSDTKYPAKVVAMDSECDLALLTVDDEEFWVGITPVKFSDLPSLLQDKVTVAGYPIGGNTISLTSGIVSRVEVIDYSVDGLKLLTVQIDAAINYGNSGGPVFNSDNQCVGVAFLKNAKSNTDNIGYIIPTPIISHFLVDYDRIGSYDGFPDLGIKWQSMENQGLRKSVGMQTDQKGVYITQVNPMGPAAPHLCEFDVLLSVDGIGIGNDGSVPFRRGERVECSYTWTQKYIGDTVKVEVLRDKKVQEFELQLASCPRLIPLDVKERRPTYYIVGGIVLVPASIPYLNHGYYRQYSKAPTAIGCKLEYGVPTFENEEVVVVSEILAGDVNNGYEFSDFEGMHVVNFNDVPVKNLKQLANMVEDCKEEFLRFETVFETYKRVIVLETEAAKAQTPDILNQNYITSASSLIQ